MKTILKIQEFCQIRPAIRDVLALTLGYMHPPFIRMVGTCDWGHPDGQPTHRLDGAASRCDLWHAKHVEPIRSECLGQVLQRGALPAARPTGQHHLATHACMHAHARLLCVMCERDWDPQGLDSGQCRWSGVRTPCTHVTLSCSA